MWKRIAACLAVLALLAVVGCGGGDKDSGKNKNQDKPKQTDDI